MADALRERPNREELPRIEGANVMEDGRYMPPPVDGDGKTWVRTSALIQATPQDCYALWRNHAAAPLWQEQIKEVRVTGERTSHWVMDVKGNITEWDAQVMADEPGKRIAWRSIGGDSENAGEVVFEEAPGGRGTIVSVLQEFGQGKLKTITDTVVNRNPKQSVIENLRHFKAFVETGEIPTTNGQPHGPRGAVGSVKATVYGEHIETPPGSQVRKAS
ncbi:MAG: SRPBCC family protein [Acidobacteriota bacterium]